MTYQELLKLINPANQARRTTSTEAAGDTEAMPITTVLDGWYDINPDNPLVGSVQDNGDGSITFWKPRDAQGRGGGIDYTTYGADGKVTASGHRADSGVMWRDSLIQGIATIGGAMLAGNAGMLMTDGGAVGAAGTGAAAGAGGTGAAAGAGMDVAAGTGGLFGSGAWDASTLAAIDGATSPAAAGWGAAAPAATTAGTGATGGLFGEMAGVPGMDVAAGTGAAGTAASTMGTGMTTGPMPGDVPPNVMTPDGGIDWQKLSQLASSGVDIGKLLPGLLDIGKLLPGLLGAGLGAMGGGDTSTSESQTINDPAFQQYRDSALSSIQSAANQPYQAPGFSLTQDTPQAQTDAISALTGFANGSQNLTSAANPLAAENNPYITAAIGAGARDMTDAYARLVAPTYAGASSFGNRNMGEYENADRSNLMMRIGDLSNSMRMQDHNLRASLLESGAARQDAMGNANANRSLSGANSLFGAGSTLFGQGQTNIQNQYAEFLRNQNWGREGAQMMTAGLSAPYNRTATSTTQGNRAAGALGGFTLGMQAGGLFNGQPMGNQGTARTAAGLFG